MNSDTRPKDNLEFHSAVTSEIPDGQQECVCRDEQMTSDVQSDAPTNDATETGKTDPINSREEQPDTGNTASTIRQSVLQAATIRRITGLITSARTTLFAKQHPPPIRRLTRQRVYRLKGYTTVDKLRRKRKSQRRQRLLRRLLILLLVVLGIYLIVQTYMPFLDMKEWRRILGLPA